MSSLDDDIDTPDEEVGEDSKPNVSKKKVLFFLVPGLILISVLAGIFYLTRKPDTSLPAVNYSIITHPEDPERQDQSITILYDLPEIDVNLAGQPANQQILKVKVNIELSNIEDIKVIEALTAKFIDAIIAHTNELTPEEVSGSEGLYWLKEELLHRMNLIADPVKISNLNFKIFEIHK